MATATRSTLATSLALTIALAVSACTGGPGGSDDPADEPPPSDTASESAEPAASDTAEPEEPTTSPEPSEEPAPDPDAVPAGFPDPATLIGQPAYDERSADGSWHTVVGGTPLELANTLGACFEGGTGDICAYSISSSAPAGPDGMAAAAEAALLLLLRSTGHEADGTPTWEILDAIIARTPDGAPAMIELCEGSAPAVAIYPEPGAASGSTIPVAAAWGPSADASTLVEVEPASLTCAYVGD